MPHIYILYDMTMKRKQCLSFFCAVLFMLASGVCAQHMPQPLLSLDGGSWHYATNAEGKALIDVVPASEIPAGLDSRCDSVYRLVSKEVRWKQWWWCGTVVFDHPIRITAERTTLKISVYSPVPRFGIVLKSDASDVLLEAPSVEVMPGTWNTFEFNLSAYIGRYLGSMELVPHQAGQTFYVCPRFDRPAPAGELHAETLEPMGSAEDTFWYGTSFYDTDVDTSESIRLIDVSQCPATVPVEGGKSTAC